MNTKDAASLLGLPISVQLVGKQPNVPGTLLDTPGNVFQLATVHDTANTAPGANAQMHRNFVANGGGTEGVSFTYSVDDHQAVQILPENQQQYAQGTARGNATSISIETCINSDGNWDKTIDNLAKLIAALLFASGRPSSLGKVVQHYVWYGKDCPGRIRHTPDSWEALLTQVDKYIVQLAGGFVAPENSIQMNGFTIKLGFLDLWNKHQLEVMGLPLSNEYTVSEPDLGGISVTYQDFENVMAQWYPGIQPRICAAVRRLKYGK